MRIEPVRSGDQDLMGAFLDDAAVLHADDPIAVAHGREAMGDDDHGAALHDLAHIGENDTLALVIEGTRGLVENKDRGIVASARAIASRCR